ncbi:hypothetical protein CPB84DRAFT_1855992 [Gymnopilus junonius]|uniref:Endonuclease/exonuclease/phosphatase domain-containing protein n=1 Tax=Gymnopilus junonius TaxID=109634 RepID=A0A9P5N8W4_GYMJU|nr:hypothetical protein CPB84DRAFT_1855992 [Gymnopilus junonius]
MPHLQHLSLSGIVPHPDFEPPEPESIVLSNLTYLRVEFEDAMTFALGIKPAAYSDFIALTRIMSRYGQPYFSSWNVLSLAVTISRNYFEFHVVQADDHLPSSSTPVVNTGFPTSSVFHVSLQSLISFTPNSSGLITPFLMCDLSSVKELELMLEPPVWGLDPFFRALSDVQILWADSLGLDTLMLNEELSSESDPLLPKLHTLRLPRAVFNQNSFRASFAKFYNKRKACQFLPLLTLDLGSDPREKLQATAQPQSSMFNPRRLGRDLSVFDHAGRRWAAIPLRPHAPSTHGPSSTRPADRHTIGKQLSLTSWNIQASRPKLVERSELILDHILKGPKSSDIIFLQEVAPSVRQSLLDDPRVRSSFLTTDAEDDAAFKGVPFATMTLLSNERFVSPLLLTEMDEGESESKGEGEGEGGSKMALDSVFRMTLPSRYERDALCVNIRDPATPGAVMRLLNVHLDSLDSWFRRALQMHLLDDLLREDGCSGGIIAGDFNAIHANDDTLVDKHGLVDAWVALPRSRTGPDGGAT